MNRISTPELNNAIIGWIHNEAYRQLWKVSKWFDFEDLVQDGLLIALKCRERYGTDLDPAHFLSLVKTSFRNHIVNLQRSHGAGIELNIAELDVWTNGPQDLETRILDTICEPIPPEQEFAVTLAELPEAIKSVLRLFLSEDSLRRLRLPLRVTLNDEETTAKRLKRLAGWPEEKDFASELEKRLFPG